MLKAVEEWGVEVVAALVLDLDEGVWTAGEIAVTMTVRENLDQNWIVACQTVSRNPNWEG